MKRKTPTALLDEMHDDFIEMLSEERKERGYDRADDRYKEVVTTGIAFIAFYLRCIFFLLTCGIGVLFTSILTR